MKFSILVIVNDNGAVFAESVVAEVENPFRLGRWVQIYLEETLKRSGVHLISVSHSLIP